jgi:hypothetical protein
MVRSIAAACGTAKRRAEAQRQPYQDVADSRGAKVVDACDVLREPGSRGCVDGYASTPGEDSLNWRLACARSTVVTAELLHPTSGTPAFRPGP